MVDQELGSVPPERSPDPTPALTILIVNRNAASYLNDCLRSVLDTLDGLPVELILVDAESTDDSIAVTRRLWPSATVVSVPERLGYVKGNNVGLRHAHGRYTMLLNSDTVLHPGALRHLVGFLDEHPAVGVASGRILNPDGTDQGVIRRFPSAMNGIFGRRSWLSRMFPNNRWYRRYMQSRGEHTSEPFPTEIVSAASMVVRTDLARELGGLNERFRFYWVDAEFCCRVARKGYQVYCVPQAKVMHYEGKGSATSTFVKRVRLNIAFNHGAYLAYVEYYRLGRVDPRRLLAALILVMRTLLLFGTQLLRPSKSVSSGGAN